MIGSLGYECQACASACRLCTKPNSDAHCIDPTPLTSTFLDSDCAIGAVRIGDRCVYTCPDAMYPLTIANANHHAAEPSLGYVQLPGTHTGCSPCTNYDCQVCKPDEPDKCLSCRPNPWFKSVMEVPGKCQEECPFSHYVTTSQTCVECDGTCATCDGPGPSSCLTCSSGTPLMHRGMCLTACPDGFAPNASNYCLPCDRSCTTCESPFDSLACTTCHAPPANAPFLDADFNFNRTIRIARSAPQASIAGAQPRGAPRFVGPCISVCPTGKFGNTTLAVPKCQSCDRGCSECTDRGKCLQCIQPLPSVKDLDVVELQFAGFDPANGVYTRSGDLHGTPSFKHATEALWIVQDVHHTNWLLTPSPSLVLYSVPVVTGYKARPPRGGWRLGAAWGRKRALTDGWESAFDQVSDRSPPPRDASAKIELVNGICTPASGANFGRDAAHDELVVLASSAKDKAGSGQLDTGYPVASVALSEPPPRPIFTGPNATEPEVTEIQRIVLTGDKAMSGTFSVTFNDEKSGPILLKRLLTLAETGTAATLEEAATMVKEVLEATASISKISVNVSSTNLTESTVELSMVVVFRGVPEDEKKDIEAPQNLGPLPLMVLNVNDTLGVHTTLVSVLQKGSQTSPGLDKPFAEQVITLNTSAATFAALTGTMTITFKNRTTIPLSPRASSVRMREALMDLVTIGDVEVFRHALVAWGAATGMRWLVRFYTTGGPSHVGPQPPFTLGAAGLRLLDSSSSTSRRRRLSGLDLELGSESTVPYVEPVIVEPVVDDEVTTTGNGTSGQVINFVTPLHICGNGIRSSAEACDDNNTDGGDGCDALCRIELGFKCTSSMTHGSGVGGLDTCEPDCGDGRRILWSNAEQCDDNNTVAGDGCSPTCTVEAGFACSGGSLYAMDICSSVCGDGMRVGSEACDDGTTLDGDGCKGDCSAIEAGYACSGGNSSVPDVCDVCHASCATCSGVLASECTSCAAATPLLVEPSTCVESCTPLGKYASDSKCEACHSTCATCSGPTSTACLSCTGTAAFLQDGACVEQCSNARFVEMIGAQATCMSCYSSCLTCSSSQSTGCLSCPSTSTPYLDKTSCLALCPDGKYADSENECKACYTGCATCTGPSSTSCTSCNTGGTFDGASCTFACPTGEYLSDPTTCLPCSSDCLSCDGTATHCTSCDTASAKPILDSNACIATCADGTYEDSSLRCQACHSSCATCSGGTAVDCATCVLSTPMSESGSCVAACSSGRYNDAAQVCQLCDSSCVTCNGPNATDCTSCPAHAPYLLDSTCLTTCPAGYFASSSSTCGLCSSSCTTCSGASSTDCLSCPVVTPHLISGACACPSGYEQTTTACNQINECETGANNCFDQSYCTDTSGSFSCTCPSGYTGDGVTCTDIDECALGSHVCSPHATCTNLVGAISTQGYTCNCTAEGYWGDGYFCTDVDECALTAALPTTQPHDCHSNADCLNLEGTFGCTCKSGYRAMNDTCSTCNLRTSAGFNCTDIDEVLSYHLTLPSPSPAPYLRHFR